MAGDFDPVATLADLETLDSDEMVEGYLDYRKGDPEPGLNRGRSYWHGWCNRRIDAGDAPKTDAAARLAHEFVRTHRETGNGW